MKTSMIVICSFLFTTNMAIAATADINPFTGGPLKADSAAKPKAAQATIAEKQPYLPAPPMGLINPQYIPQNTTQQKPEEKKKELDPNARFVIDGIVNDNIIIKDLMNEDKIIYVNDLSVLENGCLVKYPFVLCGKAAEKALRTLEDKEELSKKVVHVTKENGELKIKIASLTKQLSDYEHKIRQLEPKAVKTENLSKQLEQTVNDKRNIEKEATEAKAKLNTIEKYISEKDKFTVEIAALQKTNAELAKKKEDLEKKLSLLEPQIPKLKADYETQIAKIKADSDQVINKIKNDFDTTKAETKEAMLDLSALTNILYASTLGVDYNIPKIGKFKGVLFDNNLYAFTAIAQQEKADSYFNKTVKRAYKTDKYILYIVDKKLVEE